MNLKTLLYTAALLAFPSSCFVHGQATQGWDGGTNTWDVGHTGDWNGSNTFTNGNGAYFGGTPGTVTVDNTYGTVTAYYTEFEANAPGTYEISGPLTIDNYPGTATFVQTDGDNQANVTFTGPITLDLNPNNETSYLGLYSPTTTTFGAINFTETALAATRTTRNDQNLVVNGANGSTTIFNGLISADPGIQSSGVFGSYGSNSTAVYEINGGISYVPRGGPTGKDFDFASGNILVGTSNLGTGAICFVGNGNSDSGASVMSFLTTGTQTLSNVLYAQNRSNAQVGASDNSTAVYNGGIYAGQGAGNLDLHAGTNSSATFNGDLGGNNAYDSKSGTGTVILNEATGNDYSSYTVDDFEMKQGTTIIKNVSGSAFGNSSTQNVAGLHVQIDSGATLGGSGISTQSVMAMAPDSVITPGVQTVTPTTLHLNGGLTAANGLTMNFALYGTTNDSIDFGGSTINLNGIVTINLTGVPTINSTDNGRFKILTGLDLTDSTLPVDGGLSFDINPPAGYTVSDFGSISGGSSGTNDYIYVDLTATAVPEPSTYAMMGLGLTALVFFARRTLA